MAIDEELHLLSNILYCKMLLTKLKIPSSAHVGDMEYR